MASAITHFRIEGLHGERTIDVPITENRLIIVGENGTGKSTVVTLLFYFLTRQWSRITSHEFKSISATIGGEEVAITRDDVSQWSSILHDDEWLSIASRRAVDLILRDNTINADASDGKLQRDAVMRLVAEHDLPPSAFLDAMRLLERRDAKVPESVKDAERVIGNAALGEVLFLPTYRRIEQDLRAIFPGSSSEMRAFRERASHRPRRQGYVELVEFGMEDVESNIQSKMNQIKEYIRSGLTNLTARYLRDVIRGEYESVEYSAIASVDDSTIDAIFSRIQESILSSAEQDRLRDIVDKIKGDSDILSGEKIVAHFLDRLIKLYEEQQSNEKDVRDFVSVCNRYLVGKKMIYDQVNFDISIEGTVVRYERGKDKIKLNMLSSGEKQIVSLFSHIYFSSVPRRFVIIDEPELSLSVTWQQRLLPDLLRTDRCQGLIAVTHSPFIYDNELDPYTRGIDEFTCIL